MLSNLKEIVKNYKIEITLLIVVILISLFSFAIGYILSGNQERKPLDIEVFYRDINNISSLWII